MKFRLKRRKALSDRQISLIDSIDDSLGNLSIESKAAIVGTDVKTYKNWISGRCTAPIGKADIEKAFTLISLLEMMLHPEGIPRFFISKSKFKNNLSPLDRIKDGKIDEVIKEAESYLDPSYG